MQNGEMVRIGKFYDHEHEQEGDPNYIIHACVNMISKKNRRILYHSLRT
jgi:hypothetical protein